jgi:MoaA/NifB/PqqE/SkfB family radical SAM enzyme
MYITGIKKDVVLLKTLMSNEMRSVGMKRLTAMKQFLKHDKLVELDGRYVINSFLPPFPSKAFDSLGKGIHDLADDVYAPVSTYISVTNRCNFSCWHCSKSYRGGTDADTGQMKELVKTVQDQGVAMIGFTGGEPLLRRDLEEIVAAVDDRSASLIFTTGDTLTRERAGRLKEAGLFAMAVSLDHWEEAEHNKRRGRDDAYQTAIAAIELSLEHGFYTMIQLVCTREMVSEEAFSNYR